MVNQFGNLKFFFFRKIIEDKEYPMVMSMYLTIIARILILDQVTFSQILQGITATEPMEKILDVWISKMPLVTQQDKRKLLSKNKIWRSCVDGTYSLII